jgi:hypothetical protein
MLRCSLTVSEHGVVFQQTLTALLPWSDYIFILTTDCGEELLVRLVFFYQF